MRSLLIGLLILSTGLLAQDAIRAGTVLPAQLNSSLDSQKAKPGQVITARVMQDIPLPGGRKIPVGAKVGGRIIKVAVPATGSGAVISLQFDTVSFSGHSLTVVTNLRALASMMEVADAQVPTTGTDRGTPWAWMTTNQIGGEVVYGQGGPVMNGSKVVGYAVPGGVLARLSVKPGTPCRGALDDSHPQALWVFSSDACGVYGFADLEIAHPGRTSPVGQITLTSTRGPIHIRGGSGLLLRVDTW